MYNHILKGMGLNMKLYEVPRNSFVKLIEFDAEPILKFIRIDGMYSICENYRGGITHILAACTVEIVDKPEDWYE